MESRKPGGPQLRLELLRRLGQARGPGRPHSGVSDPQRPELGRRLPPTASPYDAVCNPDPAALAAFAQRRGAPLQRWLRRPATGPLLAGPERAQPQPSSSSPSSKAAELVSPTIYRKPAQHRLRGGQVGRALRPGDRGRPRADRGSRLHDRTDAGSPASCYAWAAARSRSRPPATAKAASTSTSSTSIRTRAAAPTHKGGPNDVEMGDLAKLQNLLHGLRSGRDGSRARSKGQTPLWVTEFSWDSKPPDPGGLAMKIESAVDSGSAARSLAAKVSATSSGTALVDFRTGTRSRPFSETLQSGLYFWAPSASLTQRPKPAMYAFRFPFHRDPPAATVCEFWGRTPNSRGGEGRPAGAADTGRWRQAGVTPRQFGRDLRGLSAGPAYGDRSRRAPSARVFSGQASPGFPDASGRRLSPSLRSAEPGFEAGGLLFRRRREGDLFMDRRRDQAGVDAGRGGLQVDPVPEVVFVGFRLGFPVDQRRVRPVFGGFGQRVVGLFDPADRGVVVDQEQLADVRRSPSGSLPCLRRRAGRCCPSG